jgi:hypothetical protein
MKKKLIFLFFAIAIASSCKKDSTIPNQLLGTGNLTVEATQKVLIGNIWWKDTPATSPHWQMQFLLDDFTNPGINTVVFGPESSSGAPSFGNGSTTDSFIVSVKGGVTYLTITDDVAVISLTGRSTYYKITAISNANITLTPIDEAGSFYPAPSFPKTTLVLVKAQY